MSALPVPFTLLQVTPRLDGGGVEGSTLDMAIAVAGAGGRSLVASSGGAMESALAAGGGALMRLPVHTRNPLVMAKNARRLADLIRRESVDLIHVRSRAPAFSALWAARAAGIPLVATYHGIYSARSGLKRWYNAVMTRGDIVIANSAYTQAHILAQHGSGGARVEIIPEGIDTRLFDPSAVSAARVARLRSAWKLPDGARVLLLAARLTGWKGQGVMIDALHSLGADRQTILILAGRAQTADQSGDLADRAARLGLADAIRLVGPVDDMPAAYALADLVVAPSTQAESFGRSVVEAAAMQVPVLASPLGGPAETVVDGVTGWLVPARDVAAWSAALRQALARPPEVLARMGQAARARVMERYSLDVMCAATFAVYRRLVEAPR